MPEELIAGKARIGQGDVWFVYDGDCPICHMAAHALRIKQDVGALHLVNAREDKTHPVLMEVNERGFDLDAGMVLKFQHHYYHGKDALHMMALLGSNSGWFNRMNAVLYRSKIIAAICYPLMRATRNILLRIKGVDKLQNLFTDMEKPIFQTVLGEAWHSLPPIMKAHYALCPFSGEEIMVKGKLDVRISWLVALMSRITGMLLPYSGKDIPVTVIFRSDRQRVAFYFKRIFHFPDKGDVVFHSHMEPIGGNQLIEFMKFGIGWKLAYHWDGEKMILSHRGYVWRIAGWLLPLPLSWVIGKGYAEEIPLSDTTFSMWTHARHPLFGNMFGYAGEFKVATHNE